MVHQTDDAGSRENELHRLLADYFEAVDAGAAPDRAAWIGEHPQFRAELEAFFVDWDEVAVRVAPLCVAARAQAVSCDEPVDRRIGDYELLDELGRGGMGVVYRARHVWLGRIVALKMIRDRQLASPAEVRRMQNEAEAIAALDHPLIVPIYEVGDSQGQVWFAMKHMSGGSLARRLEDYRDRPRAAAEMIESIARAVDHAHQRGVLHRDLKPSNVLLDEDGRPHVADFGLARRLNDDLSLTATDEYIGTPPFMSPEQARRDRRSITVATDVYGLGAILYALLTGRAPFEADTLVDVLVQVCDRPPSKPRSLNADVPRDLETICLKALDKDPRSRYPSAAAMADDLLRFLDGRTILARPASSRERAVRWMRRRPAVAALMVLTLLGITLLIAGLSLHNRTLARMNARLADSTQRAVGLQQDAERSRLIAVRNERRSEELLYQADVFLAMQAWREHDLQRASELLKRHVPVPGEPDDRGFEWYYLWNRLRMNQIDLESRSIPLADGASGALYYVCLTPQGDVIATAGADAVVHLLDAQTHELLTALPTGQIEVNGLAFTSDGQTMATAGDDGTVRLWDWKKQKELLRIPAHSGKAYQVGFTPDDRLLLSCGTEPVVRVWDHVTGTKKFELRGHTDVVESIGLRPNGADVISGGSDHDVRIWSLGLTSGEERFLFRRHLGRVLAVAWSPADESVASASIDGVVSVWSAGRERHNFLEERLVDPAQSLAYSRNGRRLACGDRGGVVHVWRIPTDPEYEWSGRRAHSWKAHEGRIYGVAFSHDGQKLLSAGQDGQLKVWDRLSSADVRIALSEIRAIAPMTPGPVLAAVGKDGLIFWNSETGEVSAPRTADSSAMDHASLAIAADADRMAMSLRDDLIEVWDLSTRTRLAVWTVPDLAENPYLALSPDGRLLAAEGETEQVHLLDTGTGRVVGRIPTSRTHDLRFSPDGRWLALDDTNDVLLWDVEAQRIARRLQGHSSTIEGLAFSPDSRWLASCGNDRRVRVWSVDSGRERFAMIGHRALVRSVAFSPDGRTLASVAEDATVKLWHVGTGQELCQLPSPQVDGPSRQLDDACFSSDSRRLFCRGGKGELVVYDGRSH